MEEVENPQAERRPPPTIPTRIHKIKIRRLIRTLGKALQKNGTRKPVRKLGTTRRDMRQIAKSLKV
jgi:hypothetical protein